MVMYDLPPSCFTARDVGDGLLTRDVLSSKHGLPGLDASLLCQVTSRLAGLSWSGNNAELLQQTEHVKVDPVGCDELICRIQITVLLQMHQL